MIGRIVRSADFERVLRTRSQASSTHFALHHLADRPSRPTKAAKPVSGPELSTGGAPKEGQPVDDLASGVLNPAIQPLSRASGPSVWLGAVVPKRHARRSVTRSLIKRQIRAAVGQHGDALNGGLWVVRLRAPFDRASFPSAASSALLNAARGELEGLIGRVLARRPTRQAEAPVRGGAGR